MNPSIGHAPISIVDFDNKLLITLEQAQRRLKRKSFIVIVGVDPEMVAGETETGLIENYENEGATTSRWVTFQYASGVRKII